MVGHRYTQEEHEFLRKFIPGHTLKEIVAEYNKNFEDQITESRVKGYMNNHKINNGLTGRFKKGHVPANKGTHPPTRGRMAETQFKKGNLPHNTKPIGHERTRKDGYIEVKVKMRPSNTKCNDNFKLKHRMVWEKEYGPIPEGHVVIFLDGDNRNFEISNLALISLAENAVMTKKRLRSTIPEATKTGQIIAKAAIAKSKAKKKLRKIL
jgi:hypothetical protein